MTGQFETPWKQYSMYEMDRFELNGEVVYIAADRTCVFFEHGTDKSVRLASEEEITQLWDKHRIVALLSVFRSIISPASSASLPASGY